MDYESLIQGIVSIIRQKSNAKEKRKKANTESASKLREQRRNKEKSAYVFVQKICQFKSCGSQLSGRQLLWCKSHGEVMNSQYQKEYRGRKAQIAGEGANDEGPVQPAQMAGEGANEEEGPVLPAQIAGEGGKEEDGAASSSGQESGIPDNATSVHETSIFDEYYADSEYDYPIIDRECYDDIFSLFPILYTLGEEEPLDEEVNDAADNTASENKVGRGSEGDDDASDGAEGSNERPEGGANEVPVPPLIGDEELDEKASVENSEAPDERSVSYVESDSVESDSVESDSSHQENEISDNQQSVYTRSVNETSDDDASDGLEGGESVSENAEELNPAAENAASEGDDVASEGSEGDDDASDGAESDNDVVIVNHVANHVGNVIEFVSVPERMDKSIEERFEPLTAEENAAVTAALALPHNETVLIEKFNAPITRRLIASLRPAIWLNDEVQITQIF